MRAFVYKKGSQGGGALDGSGSKVLTKATMRTRVCSPAPMFKKVVGVMVCICNSGAGEVVWGSLGSADQPD